MERSNALTIEADAALEEGRFEEAAAKYRAAYYGLPREGRGSYIGSMPVRGAVRAFDAVPEGEQTEAALLSQLAFVGEFLDEVEANKGTTQPVDEEVLAELETLRDDLEGRLNARREADDEGCPDTLPATQLREDHPTVAHPREIDGPHGPPQRDWLGLGLITGGGLATGAGTGLLIASAVVQKQADKTINSYPALRDNPDASQTFRDHEDERARKLVLAGSVTLSVGLAATITGTVLLLVRRKKGKGTNLGLLPRVDSQQAVISLIGRF